MGNEYNSDVTRRKALGSEYNSDILNGCII